MDIKKIYKKRFFDKNELIEKNQIWKILCENFFCKFVSIKDTVVDVGAGYCEFINNIKCKEKIAIDINEDVKKFAGSDVKVIHESCMAIKSLKKNSIDIVFMSNFLEHLPNKQAVYDTFVESKRILKQGGRMIILQPNIRFLYNSYWDFFDHNVPLSDKSIVEALQSLDFNIIKNIPKFLPYTTKSKIPKSSYFVKLYLSFPIAWRILGKQALIIAEKS